MINKQNGETRNTENSLHCQYHPEKIAELFCKNCHAQLCLACSLNHNQSHKVVLHSQESIKFARQVISKDFCIEDESCANEEVLENYENVKKENSIIQDLFSQADKKLVDLEKNIEQQLIKIKQKSEIVRNGLKFIEKFNESDFVNEMKQYLRNGKYEKICELKEDFEKITKERNLLTANFCTKMNRSIEKKTRTLDNVITVLDKSLAVTIKIPENNIQEGIFVGKCSEFALLFDVTKNLKRIIKPKDTKIKDCAEAIEVKGNVYFIGGKNDDPDTLKYDPILFKGDLIVCENMNLGRCNHALCQLVQKFIFCAGGVNGNETISSCEKYDIENNKWTKMQNLSLAKHNGTMCSILDRFIFFIGGGLMGHNKLFNSLEFLDTFNENAEWETVELTNSDSDWIPCECMNSIEIRRGEILIFGGWAKEKDSRSSAFIYNHNKKEIIKLPSMKRNSAFFYRTAPILYKNTVYSMSPDDNIHKFSLETNEWDMVESKIWKEIFIWSSEKPMIMIGKIKNKLTIYEISQRVFHTFEPINKQIIPYCEAIFIQNSIYLIGGKDSSKETLKIDILSYEGTIKILQNLNIGRYNHAIEKLSNNYIYCCGGFCGVNLLSSCEKYSISQNKWYIIPSLTEEKQNISLCTINNHYLYCFGGGEPGHVRVRSTVEKLDLLNEENGWSIVQIIGDWLTPAECMGAAQISVNSVLLFGGWKINTKDSGKCYELDLKRNRLQILPEKLCSKTGFFYSLKPIVSKNQVYVMDPAYNIHLYDIKNRNWDMINKDDWMINEEEQNERAGCQIF